MSLCLLNLETTPTEQDRGIFFFYDRSVGQNLQVKTVKHCPIFICLSLRLCFSFIFCESPRPSVAVEVNRSVDLAAIHLWTFRKARRRRREFRETTRSNHATVQHILHLC